MLDGRWKHLIFIHGLQFQCFKKIPTKNLHIYKLFDSIQFMMYTVDSFVFMGTNFHGDEGKNVFLRFHDFKNVCY